LQRWSTVKLCYQKTHQSQKSRKTKKKPKKLFVPVATKEGFELALAAQTLFGFAGFDKLSHVWHTAAEPGAEQALESVLTLLMQGVGNGEHNDMVRLKAPVGSRWTKGPLQTENEKRKIFRPQERLERRPNDSGEAGPLFIREIAFETNPPCKKEKSRSE
jgi:hypothetical protein